MLEYLHVECAPPMVHFSKLMVRSQSGFTMHGRWYFDRGHTWCIYFPWNPWILETPSPLKALVNKGNPLSLESLNPLDLWYPWNIEPLKPCKFREYWPLNPLCPGDRLRICLWLGYYRHMSWNPLTFGRLNPWVINIWNHLFWDSNTFTWSALPHWSSFQNKIYLPLAIDGP